MSSTQSPRQNDLDGFGVHFLVTYLYESIFSRIPPGGHQAIPVGEGPPTKGKVKYQTLIKGLLPQPFALFREKAYCQ